MKLFSLLIISVMFLGCGNGGADHSDDDHGQRKLATLNGEGVTLSGVPSVRFHKCIKPDEAPAALVECQEKISNIVKDLEAKNIPILRIVDCSAGQHVGSCTDNEPLDVPTTVAGWVYFQGGECVKSDQASLLEDHE